MTESPSALLERAAAHLEKLADSASTPRRSRMRDVNAWLDRKRPYQREFLFAVVFDVCALAVLAVIGVELVLAWPSLLSLVLICAAVMAVPIAVVGQLAGYRIEDRRVAKLEEARRG